MKLVARDVTEVEIYHTVSNMARVEISYTESLLEAEADIYFNTLK
jgi:hypothetical protein